MTAPLPTRTPRDEAGFTLVELLVAMLISIIVLFAILLTLDSFSSNAARQSKVTDANAQVRAAMDRVVSDLRQAATIEVAGTTDLVYTVVDSATQTRRERICRDGAGTLWRLSATPGSPIAAGSACPTAGSSKITRLASVNSAANPMFHYDSATAGSVRSVGLTIALNAGSARHTDVSTLRASTFVRTKSETAPAGLDEDDITTSCSNTGQPTLTLSSGVGPLSVQYVDFDGNNLGSANAGSGVTLTGTGGRVIANISGSSGIVSQIVKVLECP